MIDQTGQADDATQEAISYAYQILRWRTRYDNLRNALWVASLYAAGMTVAAVAGWWR
jgi:hypothetical protein